MRLAAAVTLSLLVGCGSPQGTSSPSGSGPSTPTPIPTGPVAVVPWANLAAPPLPTHTPSAPPPGVARCRAQALQYRFDGLEPISRPMTSPSGLVSLVNGTSSPCWVQGFVDVTLFDANGASLATVRQTVTYEKGTGPEFAAIYVIPAGTSFPPPANDYKLDHVYVTFWWDNWCGGQTPVSLEITLADGSRSPRVPMRAARFDGTPTPLPPCADSSNPSTLLGTFGAIYGYPPPTPAPSWVPPVSFEIGVDRPLVAHVGAVFLYGVVLTNTSNVAVRIDQCPVVQQYMGAIEAIDRRTLLNCAGTPAIPPGRSIVFDMELPLPVSIAPGRYTLLWSMGNGLPNGGGFAAGTKFDMTVVAP